MTKLDTKKDALLLKGDLLQGVVFHSKHRYYSFHVPLNIAVDLGNGNKNNIAFSEFVLKIFFAM